MRTRETLRIALCGFLAAMFAPVPVNSEPCSDLPDCNLDTPAIISHYGFVPEIHTCRTPDGFHLTLHRITDPKRSDKTKGAVLLQHGLLDSSSTWVMNRRDGSLAFILADAGFDVWLGNNRGNSYSLAHDFLKPTQAEFWKWSWDEMARFDLPTMVGYVSTMARVEKISLVGHSQGTMQAFAALSIPSARQTLSSHLNLFVALAPVAYLTHLSSPLLRTLADVQAVALVRFFGDKSFLPSTEMLRKTLPALCSLSQFACESFACMLSGCVPGSRSHVNHTRWPVYSAHYPTGTSVQNIAHFSQGVRSGAFQRFDFGATENMARYNSSTPPPYLLPFDASVPTAIFSGSLDSLADSQDVQRLVQQLPPGMVVWREELQTWDHLTFVWGEDANAYLYPKLRALIASHARPSPEDPRADGVEDGASVV